MKITSLSCIYLGVVVTAAKNSRRDASAGVRGRRLTSKSSKSSKGCGKGNCPDGEIHVGYEIKFKEGQEGSPSIDFTQGSQSVLTVDGTLVSIDEGRYDIGCVSSTSNYKFTLTPGSSGGFLENYVDSLAFCADEQSIQYPEDCDASCEDTNLDTICLEYDNGLFSITAEEAPVLCPTSNALECCSHISQISFQFMDGGCSATTNYQAGKLVCSDSTQCSAACGYKTVDVSSWGTFVVSLGDVFTIGDATLETHLGAQTDFEIRGGESVVQDLSIRTSCSTPLSCGDVFGALRVSGFKSTTQDVTC